MKKKLGLLTLLGAASGQAAAQSNVTLYGLLDTNIEYANNFSAIPPTQRGFPGPSRNRFGMASGGLSGDRDRLP